MPATTPLKETADIIKEEGGEILKMCFQCGVCSASCPWNLVKTFLPRKLIHEAQLGLVNLEAEEVWQCVGCHLCMDRCPRGVEVIDIMRALRRVIVDLGAGKVPDSLRVTATNLAAAGNPLGEAAENRPNWAKDLGVKTFTPGTDILYFPCCYQAYDPAHQKVARATVDLLKRVKADFGIPGDNVVCCGESIRKAGHESIFQSLAQTNIDAFKEAGVNKILVTSPHCYHSFSVDYPELGGEFEVMCITQYLDELIKDGKLKPTKELSTKVTFHDSCCSGRYAGLYEEPRRVLESIPGLELVEMRDTREQALCCGGCAGMTWMDTKKGERISEVRVEQAIETGASVLATACPYCTLNLEDSLLTADKGDTVQIKHIVQLIQEAL